MAYVLREGQGSLFKNDNRTSDNHPNARGEILIGGVLYEISAWTKEGSKGKFQSLSAKPKQERRREQTITAHNGETYDRADVQAHVRESRRNERNSYGDLPEDGEIPF